MTRKQKTSTLLFAGVLLLSVISVTYAFFAAGVNDTTSDSVSMTSGSLSLTLNDMDVHSLTSWNITPSDLSRTVYLSVTNNSPIAVNARLLFNGLVNTYSQYLVYSVEEVTSNKASLGTPNVLVNQARVPISASSSNKTMVNKITMPSNSTKYYKVTIEYQYSTTVNQSGDADKTFYTGFAIEENPGEYVTYSVLYTGLPSSYSESHNIVNQTADKGSSVTIMGANVDGYTINEIRIVGNEVTTINPDYELESMNVILEIDTTITLEYQSGTKKPSIDDNRSLDPVLLDSNTTSSGGSSGSGSSGSGSSSGNNTYVQPTSISLPNENQDEEIVVDVQSSGPIELIFDVSTKAQVGDTVKLMHYVNNQQWEQVGESKTVDPSLKVSWVIDSYSPYGVMIYTAQNNLNAYKGEVEKYKMPILTNLMRWFVNAIKGNKYLDIFPYGSHDDVVGYYCRNSENNCIGYYHYLLSGNFYERREQVDINYGTGAYQELSALFNGSSNTNLQSWINSHVIGYMYNHANNVQGGIAYTASVDSTYAQLMSSALTQLYGTTGREKYIEFDSMNIEISDYWTNHNESNGSELERSNLRATMRNWLNANWISYFGNDTPQLVAQKVLCLADYYYLQAMKQQGYTNEQILGYVNQTTPDKYELAQLVIDMSEADVLDNLEEVAAGMLDDFFEFE